MFIAMLQHDARSGVRLAELLAVLSLAADLGMGQPMEHVLRQCLIESASRPVRPGSSLAARARAKRSPSACVKFRPQ
jgi:hypothetical protein